MTWNEDQFLWYVELSFSKNYDEVLQMSFKNEAVFLLYNNIMT